MAIVASHYVDDYFDRVDTIEDAVKRVKEIRCVDSKGEFVVRVHTLRETGDSRPVISGTPVNETVRSKKSARRFGITGSEDFRKFKKFSFLSTISMVVFHFDLTSYNCTFRRRKPGHGWSCSVNSHQESKQPFDC